MSRIWSTGVHVSHRTIDGPTVAHGSLHITPRARVLTAETPFGVVVWNRPSVAVVERDGDVTRLPIRDVTRLVQVALVICFLLAGIWQRHGKGA